MTLSRNAHAPPPYRAPSRSISTVLHQEHALCTGIATAPVARRRGEFLPYKSWRGASAASCATANWYLGNIAPSTPLGRLLRDSFVAEMRRLGWVEVVNASFVFRFADGEL